MWLTLALAALAALCFASVTIGVRQVSLQDVQAALGGATDTISQAAVAKRVPRTVMALLAGAALGVAGAVMQGVTRNPLADPGILGVNSGAALAVVIGMAWFNIALSYTYVWTAIGGAAAAAVFVYAVGSLGPGGATPMKLALAGTATSVALASFINAVVLGRNDIAGGVRAWMIGGAAASPSTASCSCCRSFFLAWLYACWRPGLSTRWRSARSSPRGWVRTSR